MLDESVRSNSIAARADALRRTAFVCSWSCGGLDAGWVHVAGALDIASAPELERTLLEPELQTHLVVLDLRGLAFMDSSGVHAIVDASIRARDAGRRLVLVHGSADVNRVFTLTGSSDKIEIGDIALVAQPVQALL
jgi:anti-sigma B factor antagonist